MKTSKNQEKNYIFNKPNDRSSKQGLTIKMEVDKNLSTEEVDKLNGLLAVTMTKLLKEQTKEEVIEGVYDKKKGLEKNNYDKLDSQAMKPRLVHKKKHIIIEMILEVKTKVLAYQLYQN